MAYEYGTADLGLRNPFKFEGAVRLLRGVITAAFGIVALLTVQTHVTTGHPLQAWVTLAVGLLLAVTGSYTAGSGLFQLMRFFVGTNAPASLAGNVVGSQDDEHVAYDAPTLMDMLVGRKNVTYREPDNWMERMAHTILPRILFLPPPLKNLTLGTLASVIYTVFAFVCYGLAWFSATLGLTNIGKTPVLDWLGISLLFFLIYLWLQQVKIAHGYLLTARQSISRFGLVKLLVLSIFLPILLCYAHSHIGPLPSLPFSVSHYVILMVVGGAMAAGITLFLALQRMRMPHPATEVSEYRSNWQENVHPQELFIHFETIVMANRRYQEIPNRVYRAFDARLNEEGSNDKGHFSGSLIQEVQPAYHKPHNDPAFKLIRQVATVSGQALLLVAAVMLYFSVEKFVVGIHYPLVAAKAIFYPAFFWLIGSILSAVAHVFWAELHFDSTLVCFQCKGTYAESKISTGAAIHDSTRSENVLVRSSMTPRVLLTRLVTTTFAGSGSDALNAKRYVLEMNKDEPMLEALVAEVKDFLRNRQSIAHLNHADYNSASSIYEINEQTRIVASPTNTAIPPSHKELAGGVEIMADEMDDAASSDSVAR